MRWIVVLAAALALAGCAAAPPAAPPATGQSVPIDLRRTTLIVRDIDASLAFYRDALGMVVTYDQTLTSPGLTQRAGADGVNRSRLVLLKANDGFIGMLGLWQFLDAPPPSAPPNPAFRPGEIVLLFNAADLEARFPKAAATPGVQVLGPPRPRTYPGYGGQGEIQVVVSMLADPDGHVVELNRLVSGGPRR